LRDLDHPKNPAGQHDPRIAWLVVKHHGVQRIAVVAPGPGYEAPIERIGDPERKLARDREQSKLGIEVELERR
jgi:hypothetical protein